MLLVSNITKIYGINFKAVDGFSLSVEPGRITGIVGPNGAGKSTTIRTILNIVKPDSGSITFRGNPISEETKNHIGYLPEERGLYKKNAIGDVLYYLASLKSITGADARKRISSWLERFELGGMEKRKVEELSKGNQQKVQFIASVIHNPDLLILDEPFSGLDPVNQLKFKDVVMSLREEGKGIIFCTHQLEAAEKICDTITLVNKGKVVVQGSVDQVKEQHGTQEIHLDFEGNGAFLKEHSMVAKAEVFANSAQIELHEGYSLNDIIPEVLPHLQLQRIEKVQPSLLSIFVDLVGKENLDEGFVEQREPSPTSTQS
jgi:ABC-2 type transport system ATP-binding protein